ncbi:MAG: hypothetical protein GKR90_08800 [Pseudomonadales bacterium]|nr:hypothetical protein [Pseudomonadales bacterium]
MNRCSLKLVLAFFATALSGHGLAVEVEPFETPKVSAETGFQDFFAQVAPNFFVSGQPNEAALAAMKEKGVARVINLRTHQEMDNRMVVPFDEAVTIAGLGLEYVHIPLGGPDTPYSEESLAAFADAVATSEGPVLLHCTVAWRASHMWAAYLVAHQGYSVADAVQVGKNMNMGGFPFAEFLGRSVSLDAE